MDYEKKRLETSGKDEFKEELFHKVCMSKIDIGRKS